MIITAIEPRRKGLSALYIDGEFAIKLDTETLIANHIDVGKDITDDVLHDVIEKSHTKRCKDKAMYLIEFRDHSRKELFDKLKKDYPDEIINNTLDKLESLGLINDMNFAKKYANDLINLKQLSKKGAKQKLLLKGIDKEIIDEVLDNIEVDEQDQIDEIVSKRFINKLSDEKEKRRAFNFLLRKGYSYSDIKVVFDKYSDYIGD